MSFKNWGNMRASLEALYVLDNALTESDGSFLKKRMKIA